MSDPREFPAPPTGDRSPEQPAPGPDNGSPAPRDTGPGEAGPQGSPPRADPGGQPPGAPEVGAPYQPPGPPGAPYPPPGPPGAPYPPQGGPPWHQGMPPDAAAQHAKARRLVILSHILGWGGLGFALIIGPVIGVAAGSTTLILALVGLGLVSTIAGAVVGQVGRAMQGRVI